MVYFTVGELEEYLKFSKSSIYKKCSANAIPYIKTGKNLLFNKEEIDLWLNQFSVPTNAQVVNNVSKLLKQKKNG